MTERNQENKKCGECARFKVPNSGCNWSEDVRTGIITASDKACGEFYPSKGKEKKVKKQLKDSGVTTDGCFEAIYSDGKSCFLLKNRSDFRIVESIELSDGQYFPKEPRNVPYEPYGYYEGSVPEIEDLFSKVHAEFDTWIDVEPIWKKVLASCTLLTYQQEKLQTVPYAFMYGDNESGKSTVLQILKSLCYRPMYGVTIPSADLYGYLEDSDSIGSILEDEVQGINKDTDKIKIYKAGYKQGAVVPRTLMTQFDRIIKYYRTFCFKACAGEQIPQIKGFNERFLFVSMVEGFPKKEWVDVSKEDLKRLHDLRNMLLKWRMLSRDLDLPDVELRVKGRIKELWKPILQVTHGLAAYDGLLGFVQDQQKERLSTKQNTLEGHIVKVVIDLHNEAGDPFDGIPFQKIWNDLRIDLDGRIDDKKPNVMDTSEFFQVTKNKVGYRLREILSGRTTVIKERDGDGNRVSVKAYVFDSEKTRRVAKKYGYEVSTKLPSLLSSESVSKPKSMDKQSSGNVEKEPSSLQQLGRLSNSVDTQKEPITDIQDPSITKNPLKESTGGEKASNSVPPDSILKEDIVCGHCQKWHTGACSFPGDPNCVTPTNLYAKQCGNYADASQPES